MRDQENQKIINSIANYLAIVAELADQSGKVREGRGLEGDGREGTRHEQLCRGSAVVEVVNVHLHNIVFGGASDAVVVLAFGLSLAEREELLGIVREGAGERGSLAQQLGVAQQSGSRANERLDVGVRSEVASPVGLVAVGIGEKVLFVHGPLMFDLVDRLKVVGKGSVLDRDTVRVHVGVDVVDLQKGKLNTVVRMKGKKKKLPACPSCCTGLRHFASGNRHHQGRAGSQSQTIQLVA